MKFVHVTGDEAAGECADLARKDRFSGHKDRAVLYHCVKDLSADILINFVVIIDDMKRTVANRLIEEQLIIVVSPGRVRVGLIKKRLILGGMSHVNTELCQHAFECMQRCVLRMDAAADLGGYVHVGLRLKYILTLYTYC